MRPPLTVERLEPFVREALVRFALEGDCSQIAALIIEHRNDPAYFRMRPAWLPLYHRVLAHEHKDFERERLQREFGEGWPFICATIWTDLSCPIALEAFTGKIFGAGDPLPHLPLNGCHYDHCNCSYRPISPAKLRRMQAGPL